LSTIKYQGFEKTLIFLMKSHEQRGKISKLKAHGRITKEIDKMSE